MFTTSPAYRIDGNQSLLDFILSEIGIIPITELGHLSETLTIHVTLHGLTITITTNIRRDIVIGTWLAINETKVRATYNDREALIYINNTPLADVLSGMDIT